METLSKPKLDAINKKIYQNYPEFKNVSPKKTNQTDGKTVLVYEKSERTADGKPFKLLLRVTVDAEGNILKVSASK